MSESDFARDEPAYPIIVYPHVLRYGHKMFFEETKWDNFNGYIIRFYLFGLMKHEDLIKSVESSSIDFVVQYDRDDIEFKLRIHSINPKFDAGAVARKLGGDGTETIADLTINAHTGEHLHPFWVFRVDRGTFPDE